MARRILLALACLLAWSAPAFGELRVKIDRYEPATLPDVRLWVSLLDGDDPLDAERVGQLSVYANGTLIDDADFESAADHGAPMAVSVIIDARLPQQWKAARESMGQVFTDLPDDSIGSVRVTNAGIKQVPEKEPWTDRPADLPPSLRQFEAEGSDPQLFIAAREALQSFPMAPGLEADKDDEPLPEPRGEDDPPFPIDRVLYIVGDGQMRLNADERPSARVQELVYLARRRGVRIMTLGVADTTRAQNLWVLEALARKTGGTYRRVAFVNRMARSVEEAVGELQKRLVVTAELEELRRGDPVSFSVRVVVNGKPRTTRDFTDRADNVLGFWDRVGDAISNKWEGLAVWIRILIIVGAVVIVAALVLLIVLLRVRKANKKQAAAKKARDAALALRKPCPVCANMMMPTWTECLFCAQAKQAQRPMRFRLVGRSGPFAGQALRFDKSLVVIGAGANCDIRLQEHGVSAEHCGLRDRGESEFLLSDFNTDGGTWVNGERVTQARLGEGDVIRVGASEFVFGIES